MFTRVSEEAIVLWIENNNLDEFGRYLVSGVIHGKPGIPVAELTRLEKILAKNFSVKEQYTIAKRLLKRSEYTARNIGTNLIANAWPQYKDVESCVKKAADDEDWIVREYAAGAFAILLQKDFGHFSKLFQKWVAGDSVNVKRAIALAVKSDSKTGDPKKWKNYFDLINPLMSEEAEYIRKNLGPFAIGDGLLSRFPKQVMASCKQWVRSPNEYVRWNVAMIFTAASARNYRTEGKPFLESLIDDESPMVSRAAKKALKNISKR